MNKFNIILLIILIVIIISLILIILFKYYDEKLNELVKKIDKAEKQSYEKLKEKNKILLRAINLIENKLNIKSKTFEEIKKIKIDTINSFKTETKLDKCFDEITKIKEDNSKSKKLKTFKEIIDEYNENELHIISLRTYYNNNTMKYNNLIKKFPYIIIAKIKKYNLKLLFEGKEIEKEN